MLEAGDGFAGYTIVRLVGTGGMGEVYLAQHPRLPRQDALKVLNPQVSGDEDYRQRFIREADLAAQLWHPHIVRVNDRGDWDDQLWIAMDYVDGPDAARLVRDTYPDGMPADQVAVIVTAIASALDYAHERGLLHRDVKPANILLSLPASGEPRILLSDFGIARSMTEDSGLTATEMTVGTVSYAAPEQLRGQPLDGRADQYALAGTAFHLLTGKPPYENSNPIAVISSHLSDPPPALSSRRRELAPLDEVLEVAMDKDPSGRYPTCGDFAAAFSAALDGDLHLRPTQLSVPAAMVPSPGKSTQVPRIRNRRRLVTVGVVVLVCATAAGVGIAVHGRAERKFAGPVLEGTYRFQDDLKKVTVSGAPVTVTAKDDPHWVAFRTHCSSDGCVATRTRLDGDNPTKAAVPPVTGEVHYTGGEWRSEPYTEETPQPQCLTGGTIGPGSDTVSAEWAMKPEPDGSLRGMVTATVLDNKCGNQGTVRQVPFVAVRTGETPAEVNVADPADLPVEKPQPTQRARTDGPVLNGLYQVNINSGQTVLRNTTTGAVTRDNGDTVLTKWWAFRSRCDDGGCVSTAAMLSDQNQNVPVGAAMVLDYREGQWQQRQPRPASGACASGTGSNTITTGYSFKEQADGTLQGAFTVTVLSDECGNQGNVATAPLTATRTGEIPSSAVLADPLLFAVGK